MDPYRLARLRRKMIRAQRRTLITPVQRRYHINSVVNVNRQNFSLQASSVTAPTLCPMEVFSLSSLPNFNRPPLSEAINSDINSPDNVIRARTNPSYWSRLRRKLMLAERGHIRPSRLRQQQTLNVGLGYAAPTNLQQSSPMILIFGFHMQRACTAEQFPPFSPSMETSEFQANTVNTVSHSTVNPDSSINTRTTTYHPAASIRNFESPSSIPPTNTNVFHPTTLEGKIGYKIPLPNLKQPNIF